EAVEASIKMARLFAKRQNIICMQGAFHGRTFGAMAVTKSKTFYSAGSHPLAPPRSRAYSQSPSPTGTNPPSPHPHPPPPSPPSPSPSSTSS
ncbi:hypothetical protein GALMADRAFT_252996, partial [Galerina marginata CBS 339.88]